jgi:hypothetical protein
LKIKILKNIFNFRNLFFQLIFGVRAVGDKEVGDKSATNQGQSATGSRRQVGDKVVYDR